MAVFMMCRATDPGAVRSEHWSKQPDVAKGHPEGLFLQESYTGRVINIGEMNGRDDSDFYAVVWDLETHTSKTVTYASTRGWTYPNHAEVDATPEVLADVERCRKEQAAKDEAKRIAAEAAFPAKGRTVKLLKAVTPRDKSKPSAKVGEVGEVFWIGAERTFAPDYSSRYSTPAQSYFRRLWADDRDGKRVGVKLSDGRKVFIKAKSVEVIQKEG